MAGVSTAALVLSVWMMATVRRQDEAEDQRDLGENGRSISLMASSQGGRWRHLRMSTGQVGSMPPSACDMESMRQCQEEMQADQKVKVNSLHDPRSPSRFCHDLVAPFQVPCPSKLALLTCAAVRMPDLRPAAAVDVEREVRDLHPDLRGDGFAASG
eukprot:768214-Hanusia_phi.AAC.6